MRPRHRHANARRGHHDLRIAENLPRLVDHLVLFLVVPVLGDLGVVRKQLFDDLMRENSRVTIGARRVALHLLLQLVQPLAPAPLTA